MTEVQKSQEASDDPFSLLRRVSKCNELFNEFLHSRDPEVYKEYKKFRDYLTADIKNARKKFYLNKFAQIYFDP